MKIVLIGTDSQLTEFGASTTEDIELIHVHELNHIEINSADAVIDFSFENIPSRVRQLEECGAAIIIINSVTHTLDETSTEFVRINGWSTMMGGPVVEAAVMNDALKEKAEALFSALNKKVEWTPDIVGFITPRVISMIINEAYFSLEEGVSTKDEINTAMKLGTNYPYGPFEWAEKIGLKNVVGLLEKLAGEQERYRPCKLMLLNIQQGTSPPLTRSDGE